MLDAITGAGADPAPRPRPSCAGSRRPRRARARSSLYRASYRARLVGCLRESYPGPAPRARRRAFDDFALDYLAGAAVAQLHARRARRGLAGASRRDAPRPRRARALAGLPRRPRAAGAHVPRSTTGPAPRASDCPAARTCRAGPLPARPSRPSRACAWRPRASRSARYLVAVRRGEDPPLPAPTPSFLAVSRRDWVVTITELEAAGYALLEELAAGATIARAARAAGIASAAAWSDVRAWADRGLIAGVRSARPIHKGSGSMKMPSLLLSEYPIDAKKPIETVDELQTHLVHAAMVELSTIPLYLYAAYSIQTDGYSQWSPGSRRSARSAASSSRRCCTSASRATCSSAIGRRRDVLRRALRFDYPAPCCTARRRCSCSLERASRTSWRESSCRWRSPRTRAPSRSPTTTTRSASSTPRSSRASSTSLTSARRAVERPAHRPAVPARVLEPRRRRQRRSW